MTVPNLVALSLSPTTISGGSGASSTGVVTLDGPAPAGGVVVALTSSNPQLAASVLSVTVPEGATSATFAVGTNARYRRYSGLAFSGTISASLNGGSRSALLSVTAQPRPTEVVRNPDTDMKGPACAGEAGVLFECQSGPNGTCTFKQECLLGCLMRPISGASWTDTCATTSPFPLNVPQRVATGGHSIAANIALTQPASSGGSASVTTDSIFARPTNRVALAIPTGATTHPVEVFTAQVTAIRFAPLDTAVRTIEAGRTTQTTRSGRTWVAVVPGTPPPLQLAKLELDLTDPRGGLQFAGTVYLNQLAPQLAIRSVTVSLASSNTLAATTSPSVTFLEGAHYAAFGIFTQAVASDTPTTLSASFEGQVLTHPLLVKASPKATYVQSFFNDPLSGIVGGQTVVTGLVRLNGLAPAGGAVVTFTDYPSGIVHLPASVTVPEGTDRVTFPISTSPVSVDTNVSLTANWVYSTFTSMLVLRTPGLVSLSSVSVTPSSVTGGSGSTGTVLLDGSAPSGGAVVSLSSSNPAIASVPPSVTVAAGSTTATFAITTSGVTANTSATLSGTYAGATRSATLAVNIASSPTTLAAPSILSPANDARFSVGAPIVFDWSDVAGAASYNIQIDDSSSFTAPLTVNTTVTLSRHTTSSLPRTRLYWRVRALDSAGLAGAWSSVRRVEVN